MIKKCPNCGHENVSNNGNINFCEACGRALPQENNEFEYNFGEPTHHQNAQSTSKLAEILGADNGPYGVPSSDIQTKKHPVKLNKYVKELFVSSIAMTIFYFLRMIFAFIAKGDYDELEEMLKMTSYRGPETQAIEEAIGLYPVAIAFTIIALVGAIAFLVCMIVSRNFKFPTSNENTFKRYKLVSIFAIIAMVLSIVYFGIEIKFLFLTLEMTAGLDDAERMQSITQTMSSIIFDVVITLISIISTFYSVQLANAKVQR